MTPKERDLLEKNEYYLLKSTITDKPYIDQNNGCYMFDVMSDATAFGEALNQDVHIENAKYYPYGVFCTAFYSYGIDHINVKQKGVKDYTVVKLLQEDADKQYFNPFANLLVYRLKQTSKKKYLRQMKDVKFITPILIDIRVEKAYPLIHYSYALPPDKKTKYYPLFTTIQEFNKWNKEQKGTWSPLETTLLSFNHIRKNDAIIINPASDGLVLSNSHLANIGK